MTSSKVDAICYALLVVFCAGGPLSIFAIAFYR